MTPSFLDGSHVYTSLSVRLRSVALKLAFEISKRSKEVREGCSGSIFRRANLFSGDQHFLQVWRTEVHQLFLLFIAPFSSDAYGGPRRMVI